MAKQWRLTPYMGAPGGLILKFRQERTPILTICKQLPKLNQFIIQSSYKNAFRTKCDSIYSKLMANQLGILYMGTPGGQIPKF